MPFGIVFVSSISFHSDSFLGRGIAVFSTMLADSLFAARMANVAFFVSFRFRSVSRGLPSRLLERLMPISGGLLDTTETELIGAKFLFPSLETVETSANGLGEMIADSHLDRSLWLISSILMASGCEFRDITSFSESNQSSNSPLETSSEAYAVKSRYASQREISLSSSPRSVFL